MTILLPLISFVLVALLTCLSYSWLNRELTIPKGIIYGVIWGVVQILTTAGLVTMVHIFYGQ